MNDAEDRPAEAQDGKHPVHRRSLLLGGAAIGSAGLLGSGLLTGPAFATELDTTVPAAAPAGMTPAAALADTTPTVVYTTSFEDADPDWVSDFTAYDTTQSRTGATSLRYTRTDSSTYVFAGKKIAGTTDAYVPFSVSVWVKTAGMQNGGASVCLEWYAEDGTYLSGGYTGVTQSTDWIQLTVPPQVAPAGAAYMKAIFFLSRGATGSAWYDDLTITKYTPKLLRATLAAPTYRGLLIPGDHREIDLRIGLYPPAAARASDYRVQVELTDAAGRRVHAQTFAGDRKLRYTRPVSKLAYGAYQLRISARTRNGEIVQDKTLPLRKLRPDEVPTTYLDQHGRVRHNGELYFPIGAFNGTTTVQNLNDLLSASFTTVLSYQLPSRQILDETHARGMTTLFVHRNADANEVLQYKDHPSLLGWYINDETPADTEAATVRPRYTSVTDNDPNHPTYSVDYRVWAGDDAQYVTDAFGTDPYPIFGKPTDLPRRVFTHTEATIRELPNTAIWPVIQLHNLGNYRHFGLRPPNLIEVRNMSWQAIVAGATGLLYYSRFDIEQDSTGVPYQILLGNARTVVSQVRELSPVILSTERVPQIRVNDDDWLRWTTRRHGNREYLFVVNLSKEPRSVTFSAPGQRPAQVLYEHRTIEKSRGKYTDSLDGLGVHLYQMSVI
ncbi:hypothetical protein GCM10009827_116560 [Dactylosporangium maewongense]|uniref:CBM-cenC domain-containing protein n=1 Tax=Dactylosporangium maewongense TaxID=634393 RepID=A0ABP4PB12_9ACTN